MRCLFERCRGADYSAANEYGVRWAVEYEDDALYVLFSETVGKPVSPGWRTCFRFWPKRWRYGIRAHAGFVDGWESIADDVSNAVAEYELSNTPIVFAGFSKGGALAQLAYLDIGGRPTDSCVAFGAPRVFWPWWSKASGNIERHYVRGDTVTRVPPLVLGYRHVGQGNGYGVWRLLLLPFTLLWQMIIGTAFHSPKLYSRMLM